MIAESDIVGTIGEAIEQFGDDPSIIFATGPSKTADVEGILIEGIHGPGIQIVLVLPSLQKRLVYQPQSPIRYNQRSPYQK